MDNRITVPTNTTPTSIILLDVILGENVNLFIFCKKLKICTTNFTNHNSFHIDSHLTIEQYVNGYV